MREFAYVLTLVAVIALAFWAYSETHLTQQSEAELRSLQREISALREALDVQRAEWAYLNRPQRLRELVELNFDRLELVAFTGAHFGRVEQIAYPPRPLPELSRPIDVMGMHDGATR